MGITLDNASNNAAFIRLLTNWAIEKEFLLIKMIIILGVLPMSLI